jgi:serine protease
MLKFTSPLSSLLMSILFVFSSVHFSLAQQLTHKLGDIMVQLEPQEDPIVFSKSFETRTGMKIAPTEHLSRTLNIWLFTFDYATWDENALLLAVSSSKGVLAAQFNRLVHLRETVPNDPRFTDQWMWRNLGQSGGNPGADISLTKAWDFTTGGVTANGDTIVVAVLDSGVDLNHVDLRENSWRNWGEIPGDGIDNDGNGYVDDLFGWNFSNNSPNVNNNATHGTAVAGMIGAIGNNSVGISGVNWKVKIMHLVRSGATESFVVQAYDYALQFRIKYNQTQGQEGAFVVATNASFGIDNANPNQFPIWCNFYDAMGQHGVLSCGATSNSPVNVDVSGDMPTGCPSEYLISVTATDHRDRRNFSGYGINSIEVAAPGQNVLSLTRNGGYAVTSGTSFASPTVAGLIALLYAYPCPNFGNLIRSNPIEAAVLVREAIYLGVDKIPELINELTYGGRINAFNSMEIFAALCSDCPIVTQSLASGATNTTVHLDWSFFGQENVEQTKILFRPKGNSKWREVTDAVTPMTLGGLEKCTEYEYRFINFCDSLISDTSKIFEFQTLGCCDPLEIEEIVNLSDSEIFITWTDNFNDIYELQYRLAGSTQWNSFLTSEPNINIKGLAPCAIFEFRVRSACFGQEVPFGSIQTFFTAGCQSCSDNEYCIPFIDRNFGEYISAIELNDWVYNNSSASPFYEDQDFIVTQLTIGKSYALSMTPGFLGTQYDEMLKAWIDLNGDGKFTEDELILNSITPTREKFTDTFRLSENIKEGITKIRFSMFDDSPTLGACDSLRYGFVRDFCIQLSKPQCAPVSPIDTMNVTFTSAEIFWDSDPDFSLAFTYRHRRVGSNQWSEEIATLAKSVLLENLLPCADYEFQVRNICRFDTTSYRNDLVFTTKCLPNSIVETAPLDLQVQLFPNPFQHNLSLNLESKYGMSGTYFIQFYSMEGTLMNTMTLQSIGAGSQILPLETSKFPPGVYIIQVRNDKNQPLVTKKAIRL